MKRTPATHYWDCPVERWQRRRAFGVIGAIGIAIGLAALVALCVNLARLAA